MKREKKVFYIMSIVIWFITIVLLALIAYMFPRKNMILFVIIEFLIIILGAVANSLNMAFYTKSKEK